MELKWLEDYLSLCNSGNFRVSSEQRFVSQPAFSRRIKALETWIGAELIDRTSYPVQPTDAGQEFKSVAQHIVSLSYQARNDIREQIRGSEEKLCIATLNTLAEFFIPSWLKELKPFVETEFFSVRTDFRSIDAYLSALDEGIVDFYISYEDNSKSVLIDADKYPSLLLGTETMVPVASPDSDGRTKWWLPSSPQAPIPYLQYTSASIRLHSFVESHLKKRYSDLTFTPAYEASFTTALKAMAIEGYGVAWLPYTIIRDDLVNGKLVRVAEESDDILIDIKIFKCAAIVESRVDAFWQTLMQHSLP
ncbi:LysR family transcriptional regulator [Neptunomonas antarctica]|uniref:Transcriptional regulator, LysR family n=1 Tax=Neptunomonas antarctica TaxID=619304 RepID=A0A1N7NTN8_9GAMM|nr:LysR family transcriptional regulator [Neptunomonas antarctica]SIT01661.1 transcriptional regulator, LysR family [Neptunomonas antarctica]